MYVSYAPELDIAACGETPEQAKRNLLEVLQINFDEMRKLGTLHKFLQDAGFSLPEEEAGVVGQDKQLIGFGACEVVL